VLVGLCLTVSGCAGEDDSSIGKPGLSQYEADRQALASNKKRGPKPPRKSSGKGKGKELERESGFSEGFEYAIGEVDYFYDPRGKRDPFRSIRFVDAEEQNQTFGPLGDFELVQLELSAVIWDASNPRALILDPGGRSYIIREGSAIGKHNGQVIHIGDNLVLVKETYEDFAGDRTTRDVELRIRMSQGG
jgi:type IV pilus assembly protein PilP